jgi:hypothetical protein
MTSTNSVEYTIYDKNGKEVKKLNHYSNLRPMWGSDNIRKSNKMLGD